MDNWFKSKWFVRIISLIFAVFIYTFVNVSENSSQSDSTFSGTDQSHMLDEVPVEIKIDDENYVVSGVPEYVTVNLQGSSGKVMPLISQRNFDVFVNLHGLEEGEHTVELQHTISKDIETFIEPKSIPVTIEERASEEFSVVADFINSDKMAEGYELVSHEVEPKSVTITSSRSVIEQIGAVKVYVNLEGLEGSINNREVPVNVYDTQGNELNVRIEPESVQVSAELDNPSKSVPITVETTGEMPEGYSLNSISANLEEVEVYATSDILGDITEVSTEAIDLSKLTESGTVEAELTLPEGVNAPDLETIEVTIDVEEAQAEEAEDEAEVAEDEAITEDTQVAEDEPIIEDTQVIEDEPIIEEELEEGLTVTYREPETAMTDIMVTGSQEQVSELSVDDFQASINLFGLEPGEHRVPIIIEGPENEGMTFTADIEEVLVQINESD
ncbi:CdaR family protein [Oceanobacillus rekensis]|uniref:CdaR family protein n=1 Tax=Oceanobacillus rekensis TaxID=937927 RepID=UPI000B43F66D|nr:CdaR family protein [Oceanobacillus rekensis]